MCVSIPFTYKVIALMIPWQPLHVDLHIQYINICYGNKKGSVRSRRRFVTDELSFVNEDI